MSEVNQIIEFDLIAEEFFPSILGMEYGECFVSDMSDLSDFSSCGMPESLADQSNDLKELYHLWDSWVISEISMKYGVELERTNINLVDLFNRISVSRNQKVH